MFFSPFPVSLIRVCDEVPGAIWNADVKESTYQDITKILIWIPQDNEYFLVHIKGNDQFHATFPVT
jgi:hypothetical protein